MMFVDWQLFRRRALGMSIAAMVIIFVIWNIPQLSFLLYPFRLFVTFVHEAGHGLAAILTGGEFIRFEVTANGSGLATTRGGLRAIIIPAGYLGTALFGTTMLYITNRIPYPRIIALGLCLALTVLSVLYGQTSQIALMVGLLFAGTLMLIALFASRYMTVFVLNVLSIMTALNALLDLIMLTRNTMATTADGRVLNDAAAFSNEIMPGTSAAMWAWSWALVSVIFLSIALYRSLLRPLFIEALVRRHPASGTPEVGYYEEENLPYVEYKD